MSQAEFEFSAGGLVVRDRSILLIQTESLGGELVWSFPKGHVEQGEHSPEAAVREVREETGYSCRLVRELTRTSYWYRHQGHLVKKTVRWFVMEPIERAGTHDKEVRQVAWVSFDEAQKRLTYPSDQELLRMIAATPSAGPATAQAQ